MANFNIAMYKPGEAERELAKALEGYTYDEKYNNKNKTK